MKGNKVTIISSLFLMTALCGCTTQSVDKAKEIEESNTYVYKYEYETNTEGQAETQYHEEKPSFDDFETVTGQTAVALKNKNGSLKFIKMNEKYNWGEMECSVTEVHMSTNIDYADEIEMKLENDTLNVGDIIYINRFFIDGKYVVIEEKRTVFNNDEEFVIKCKSANMLSSFIDVFRQEDTQTNSDKTYQLYVTHYEEEEINEKFEVIQ